MGIRESVRRFYTASLWGEIVLKSYGGGEGSSALFDLFLSSLRKLDTTPDPMVPLVSVQFLARFLLIAGTFPDTEECGSCGRAFGRKGLDTFYSSTGETLLCAECAGPDMLRLPPGVLSYLNHTLKLPVEESYRIQADSKTLSSLQTLMYSLVGSLVEVPLRTLEIGRGIL
jgi:DNA repair protein RecO